MIMRILKRLRVFFACPDCGADYVGSNPHCEICEGFRYDRMT